MLSPAGCEAEASTCSLVRYTVVGTIYVFADNAAARMLLLGLTYHLRREYIYKWTGLTARFQSVLHDFLPWRLRPYDLHP